MKDDMNKSVMVFNRTLPVTNSVQDTLALDSGTIVKTLDPCAQGKVEVTAESINLPRKLTSTEDVPTRVSLTMDVVSPQSVTEVDWEGCQDYNITMKRDGRVVAHMVILHPGLDRILTVLETLNTSETSIAFKQTQYKCEIGLQN